MSSTLFIHCGHFKTGSSALQVTLENNAQQLATQGAIYPLPAGAYCLRHNVGNGYALTRGATLEACLAPALIRGSPTVGVAGRVNHVRVHPKYRKVLLSSEFLTRYFSQPEHLQRVLLEAAALGFAEVRCLIFTRDPVEFAVSLWLQWVKTQGETRSLNDVLFTPDDGKSEMFSAVRTAETLAVMRAADVDLTIRNFGRVNRRTLPVFFSWAGLTPVSTNPSPVNRSLSAEEAAIMRIHNHLLGTGSKVLGQALVGRLPNQPVRRIYPSVEAARHFQALNFDACRYVDQAVDEDGRYGEETLDWPLDSGANDLALTHDQALVIVETLSALCAQRTDISGWGLRDHARAILRLLRARFPHVGGRA